MNQVDLQTILLKLNKIQQQAKKIVEDIEEMDKIIREFQLMKELISDTQNEDAKLEAWIESCSIYFGD